jgi:transposase
MAYRGRPTINEDLPTLQKRMRSERTAEGKRRVQMLVLFAHEQPPTRQQVAEHLGVDRKAIRRWLERYATGGIEAMLTEHKRGRKSGQRLLPETVLSAVKRQLTSEQGFSGYTELQQWIAREFGYEVNYKSLHGLVRYRLKAKLKVPRPEHPQKK